VLIKSLSLLFLGLCLTVLATLNFSLSLILVLLCAPLAFVHRTPNRPFLAILSYLLLAITGPSGIAAIVTGASWHFLKDAEVMPRLLLKLAFGWNVWGSWGVLIGVWCVWWPAWVTAAVGVASSWYDNTGAGTAIIETDGGATGEVGGDVKRGGGSGSESKKDR